VEEKETHGWLTWHWKT